ncbi:Ribosome biogenesis protein [Ascosphaera pollenicola]|nr:Ribosome biogenesis protein [Ascosphaera pollenicola]
MPDRMILPYRTVCGSEDAEGVRTIEDYSLACDPFRSTTWVNPPMLPFIEEICKDVPLKRQISGLKDEIRHATLRGLFPHAQSVTDVEVTSKLATISKKCYENYKCDLLLVRVNFNQPLEEWPRTFEFAKDSVCSVLSDNGLRGDQTRNLEVSVEARNFAHTPKLFPISIAPSIKEEFRRLEPQLTDLLEQRLPGSWRMLMLDSLGATEETARPAVLVVVDPLTTYDWMALTRDMHHLSGLPVVFKPGGIRLLSDNLRPPVGPDLGELAPIPKLHLPPLMENGRISGLYTGAPVSSVNGERAGTMGGFISLRGNDMRLNGFMTSYHVIRPSLSQSIRELDRQGISINDPHGPIQVVYPAAMDTRTFIEMSEARLEYLQTSLKQLRESRKMREACGEGDSARLQESIATEVFNIAAEERLVEQLRKLPVAVGHVRLASGKIIMPSNIGRSISDWAFVQVPDDTNICANVLREANFLHFNQLGSLEPEAAYLKVGRTTKLTRGVLRETPVKVSWPVRTPFHSESGDSFFTSGKDVLTNEWLLYSLQWPMCEAGDSGSFIINDQRQACGLLVAEVSLPDVLYCVVTPLNEIFKSIKMKWPGFDYPVLPCQMAS